MLPRLFILLRQSEDVVSSPPLTMISGRMAAEVAVESLRKGDVGRRQLTLSQVGPMILPDIPQDNGKIHPESG